MVKPKPDRPDRWLRPCIQHFYDTIKTDKYNENIFGNALIASALIRINCAEESNYVTHVLPHCSFQHTIWFQKIDRNLLECGSTHFRLLLREKNVDSLFVLPISTLSSTTNAYTHCLLACRALCTCIRFLRKRRV